MHFTSIDEILEFAIEREKEAVAFYLDLSKKETITALKETFFELAQEEGKHVKLITSLKLNKIAIESYEIRDITNLKISDYLTDMEYRSGMLMEEILVLAMKREEKAAKLYQDLEKSSADTDTQRLFLLLAQEETQHKLRFEKMYDDHLQGQGN